LIQKTHSVETATTTTTITRTEVMQVPDEHLKELPILIPISRAMQYQTQTEELPKRRRSSVTFNLNNPDNSYDGFSSKIQLQTVCDSVESIEDEYTVLEPRREPLQKERCQTWSSGSSDVSSSGYSSSTGNSQRVLHASGATSRSSVTMTSQKNSIVTQLNRNKAFKMTSIVVGTFVAGWFPVSLCQLLLVVSPALVSQLTWDVVQIVAFLVSAVNPFVYSFYSAESRWSLRRLMSCDQDRSDVPWS